MQKDKINLLIEFYDQCKKFMAMMSHLEFNIKSIEGIVDIDKIHYEDTNGQNYELVSFDGYEFGFIQDGSHSDIDYNNLIVFNVSELPINWILNVFVKLTEAEIKFNINIIKEK